MSLHVTNFAAKGYRSLRSINFPVAPLTVFVGENGAGKTNLYRSLQLLQSAAAGTLSLDLAREGGMDSAYWVGKRRRDAKKEIELGVTLGTDGSRSEGGFKYSVVVGFAQPSAAAFRLEPQIKEEIIWFEGKSRPLKLLERHGYQIKVRDEAGERTEPEIQLMASETAIDRIQDASRYPELHLIRQTLLDWRFYHDLRTDAASPLRQPCLATTSGTLASDGGNLAAVFATLTHIRQDTEVLDRTIADAFPGAHLHVPIPDRTASFGMVFPDYPRRIFEAPELSDGTLRFLALAGALLAYRAPAFIALNEPENSIHGDLLKPLARLISEAAKRTQIWLVTHSEPLATAVQECTGVLPKRVIKRDGATWIEGLKFLGVFTEEDDEVEERNR